MVDERLLKRAEGVLPYFYHLRTHPKAYNEQNYKHEKIAGDIYVYSHQYFDYWSNNAENLGNIRPDRLSRLFSDYGGRVIFWEIDRSTMTRAKIITKLERYVELSRQEDRSFAVVFACLPRRAKGLLQEMQAFRNPAVWFYAVDYRALLADPTGAVFQSPVSPNGTPLTGL